MTSLFDPCRLAGRLFYLLVSFVLACGVARALPPQTTTISDTVYRADGSAASGTLLITWPQFNTSDAVTNKNIVDVDKFRDGLGKIIDGVVACLNASVWAKTS
jgi:hypothetical protein